MKGHALVVGGGIAGLVAAQLLRPHFERVTLLEAADSPGGLLRSWRSPEGVDFDYGTHIPRPTENAEIDAFLFPPAEVDEWESIGTLKTGNFFNGRLNTEHQFIDVRSLPEPVYSRGLVDLLHSTEATTPGNLAEQLVGRYGEVFTEQVFRPLMRRAYRLELEALACDAHLVFGHHRLIVADAAASRELKRSPMYDERLAFTSYREGAPAIAHCYPKRGGVGSMIDSMVRRLCAVGVEIRCGTQLRRLEIEAGAIGNITLADGERLTTNAVVWTVAPALALAAAGFPSAGTRPAFMPVSLHHLLIDRPPQIDNHFVFCNEAAFNSFRITLYDNLHASPGPPHAVTVEVIDPPAPHHPPCSNDILAELKKMGILEPSTAMLAAHRQDVAAGFPIPSLECVAQSQRTRSAAAALADNLLLVGKGTGAVFFMNDVLLDTHSQIRRLWPD